MPTVAQGGPTKGSLLRTELPSDPEDTHRGSDSAPRCTAGRRVPRSCLQKQGVPCQSDRVRVSPQECPPPTEDSLGWHPWVPRDRLVPAPG